MPTLLTLPVTKKRYIFLRWGSRISIMWVLALLFIVPHDPSTRLRPWEVGSQAAAFSGWASRASTSSWSDARALAAVTPTSLIARRATMPQMAATSPLFDMSSGLRTLAPTVAWIAQAAVARPQKMARVVKRVTPELVASLKARQQQQQLVAPWPMGGTVQVATTVEQLRALHGRSPTWWGDLTPAEARELYHSLLPYNLLNSSTPYTLGERARLAVAARHAARLYVRERTVLPATIGCELFDGARTLIKQGAFQPSGMTEDQIFAKYAAAAGLDLEELERSASSAAPDEAHSEVFLTILRKACTTNRHVDHLVGCAIASEGTDALCDLAAGI